MRTIKSSEWGIIMYYCSTFCHSSALVLQRMRSACESSPALCKRDVYLAFAWRDGIRLLLRVHDFLLSLDRIVWFLRKKKEKKKIIQDLNYLNKYFLGLSIIDVWFFFQ